MHPTEVGYPLRPEVIESAAALSAATGAPRYARTAAAIMETLQSSTRCRCGFCSVRNVSDGAHSIG